MIEVILTIVAGVLMVWGVQLSATSFILKSSPRVAFIQRGVAAAMLMAAVALLGLVI